MLPICKCVRISIRKLSLKHNCKLHSKGEPQINSVMFPVQLTFKVVCQKLSPLCFMGPFGIFQMVILTLHNTERREERIFILFFGTDYPKCRFHLISFSKSLFLRKQQPFKIFCLLIYIFWHAMSHFYHSGALCVSHDILCGAA